MKKHASMNRAFRLIWKDVLGSWVPAAEISRGRRKRRHAASTAVVVLSVFGAHAQAAAAEPQPNELPSGGNVIAGGASLLPGAATFTIDQTTPRAAIEWSTFNVGGDAQVIFNQPGRDSATLNRVLDSNPSQIFGRITAPGQVFLTNPSGVYFGKSATVDVGGLAATTHAVDTAEFMSGNVTL